MPLSPNTAKAAITPNRRRNTARNSSVTATALSTPKPSGGLEYKTQVFVNHEGDLYRTRLTHSLEVAQIARTVARSMGLNEDLTEAIALSHDLGHTPFGHAGQDELNDCMKAYGGFEHNLQSLRVVDVLEDSYADFPGINLTFETREGILKHCATETCATTWAMWGCASSTKPSRRLEAQLTNLADEIAYNNHDIEDGLRSGLITLEQLQDVPVFAVEYRLVRTAYPDLQGRRLIRETLRRMIGRMVVDLIESSQTAITASGVQTLDEVRSQPMALMRYGDEMRQPEKRAEEIPTRQAVLPPHGLPHDVAGAAGGAGAV